MRYKGSAFDKLGSSVFYRIMRIWLFGSLYVAVIVPSYLHAQAPFPDSIPYEDQVVTVEDIAVLPDSNPGQPPRISVVATDPQGRLFANDQRGPLYHVDPQTGDVREYLDLRSYSELDLVATFETGFQSFAFHPNFAEEGKAGFGRFYTIHSSGNTEPPPDFATERNAGFDTLLLEWETDNPDSPVFVPAREGNPYREILRVRQPFGNHNAGLIAFSTVARPDDPEYGLLYIAIGDGGSGGDPQENGENPGNPYGAILRIDPLGTDSGNGQYGIPPANALAADGNAETLGEIFAYGLRNPQRFSWDLVTGNGYIADIGQNAVEEINLLANGAHYGWDLREGSTTFESGSASVDLVDPVAAYGHANTFAAPSVGIGNRAVTTGEVARGSLIPSLEGKLLLADFPTGVLLTLDVDKDSLDGGQDGLREIRLREPGGETVRLLDLVNRKRQERGLGPSGRTDVRFSIGTPGVLYLSNKHDGVLRRLRPEAKPSLSLVPDNDETPGKVHFRGILQSSPDLQSWETFIPQPRSPQEISIAEAPLFFRSIRP